MPEALLLTLYMPVTILVALYVSIPLFLAQVSPLIGTQPVSLLLPLLQGTLRLKLCLPETFMLARAFNLTLSAGLYQTERGCSNVCCAFSPPCLSCCRVEGVSFAEGGRGSLQEKGAAPASLITRCCGLLLQIQDGGEGGKLPPSPLHHSSAAMIPAPY